MKARILAAFLLLTGWGALADTIDFSADSVQSVLAQGKEKTVLSGRARVTSDKIAVTADRIEISGTNYRLLVCEGNVVADDRKNGIHLTAPKLTYDRDRSFAVLEGPAVLEDSDNHVVLKADWIQDDGDAGVTVAQVNVRILKEGLACRSEYAIYRRKEHLLELSGAPRVVKNGDEYRATRMVVNTDTEEISLEGSVSGTVQADSSKGPTDTAPGSSSSAPAGTSGPEATPNSGTATPPSTDAAPAPAPSGTSTGTAPDGASAAPAPAPTPPPNGSSP